MSTEHPQRRIALGAYLLGALDPAEHAEVEIHLGDCPDCRTELAALAGLPGQLARISPAEIEGIDTPGTLEPGMAEQALDRLASRRRTRRRRRLAAAAAAVVLAAGVASAGTALSTTGGSATPPQAHTPALAPGKTVTGSNPATGVTARITLQPTPAGTSLAIHLHGVPPGHTCRLVAISVAGHHETASTWRIGYTGGSTIPGATAIPTAQLAALRVITANGTQLITLRDG
jgi:anti-sigma factor RsiW